MLACCLKILELIWKKWLKFNKSYPRVMLIIKVSIIFALFWLISYERLDPDYGWHLAAGNYIRKFGIPAHDVFTYTARNFRWIDHEWGNDVIISYLNQLGGYLLVSFFFGALWALALFVNAKRVPFPLLWLAAVAASPFAGIRPTIWTILGLTLLIRWCSAKSTRAKLLIPLGFILWANLQGGFIVGFAYLGYMLLKERKLFWGWILLTSGLGSFVNPYGPRLYVEIARTLTDRQIHSQIKEWSHFYIPLITIVYIIFWATGFWIFAKKRLANWVSFTSLLFLAGLDASRNWPLFIVSSLGDMGNYFPKLKKSIPKHLNILGRTIIDFGVFVLVILCLSISIWTVVRADDKSSAYPVQAVAYLAAKPCSGNLFNSYNYGGYLILKLPQEPVYIDGRMPSWKDPQGVKYLDRYFAIISSKQTQRIEFKEYNIRCALLSNNASSQPLISNLESEGWVNTLQANNSILLEMNTSNVHWVQRLY